MVKIPLNLGAQLKMFGSMIQKIFLDNVNWNENKVIIVLNIMNWNENRVQILWVQELGWKQGKTFQRKRTREPWDENVDPTNWIMYFQWPSQLSGITIVFVLFWYLVFAWVIIFVHESIEKFPYTDLRARKSYTVDWTNFFKSSLQQPFGGRSIGNSTKRNLLPPLVELNLKLFPTGLTWSNPSYSFWSLLITVVQRGKGIQKEILLNL